MEPRGMLHFHEAFAGGWFGLWRTYGAIARLECESLAQLQADWPVALSEVAAWRARRGSRADLLHFYLLVSPEVVWPMVGFVAKQLLVAEAERSPELRGLRIEVAVFGARDMEQYLDVVLFPGTDTNGKGKRRNRYVGARV